MQGPARTEERTREPRKNTYGAGWGPSEGLPKAMPSPAAPAATLHYAKPSPFFMDPMQVFCTSPSRALLGTTSLTPPSFVPLSLQLQEV